MDPRVTAALLAITTALLPTVARTDPLPVVTAVDRAALRYYAGASREAEALLRGAVASIDGASLSACASDPDRAAYLRALALLTRIALDGGRRVEARAWVTRALAYDPRWSPSPRESPPSVLALVRAVGTGLPRGPSGRSTLGSPPSGCVVRTDGGNEPPTGAPGALAVFPREVPAAPTRALATTVSPRTDPPRGVSGAGPWLLAGAGAAGIAAGVTLLALRARGLGDLADHCARTGGVYVCPDADHPDAATLRAYGLAGGVAVTVGVAALAGALVWQALGVEPRDGGPGVTVVAALPTPGGAVAGVVQGVF